jgi:hypothetical protein
MLDCGGGFVNCGIVTFRIDIMLFWTGRYESDEWSVCFEDGVVCCVVYS